MINYQSIVAAVKDHALQKPDSLCMADPEKSLSYSQAWKATCGFASYLKTIASPGSYAVMECNQRCEFVVAMLALQLAGIVAVPVERNASQSRISEICAETGAAAFIGSKKHDCVSNLPYINLDQACAFEAGGGRRLICQVQMTLQRYYSQQELQANQKALLLHIKTTLQLLKTYSLAAKQKKIMLK